MTYTRIAVTTAGAAAAMSVVAMLLYPGGTVIDRTTSGYSLTQNFLSDLGMTVAYGGGGNRFGAVLFVAALSTLLVGGVLTLKPVVAELLQFPRSRPWAGAAATCVLLTCIAFTGVAFTPENRAMDMHVTFTVWGWRVIALLSLLLGVAGFRAGGAYRRVAYTGLVTGVTLAAYSALFVWGPDGQNPRGLAVHVVSQKVAAIIVLLALISLSRVAPRRAVP